jgi:hypothetical protein
MWRGRVASAIRGKRGQALLRDCLAALDAMPVKRLIPDLLVDGEEVCTLGAAGKMRKIAGLEKIDPEEHEILADLFNVSHCLIAEIEYENDERRKEKWVGRELVNETPEDRFNRMHDWLLKHIVPTPDEFKEPSEPFTGANEGGGQK